MKHPGEENAIRAFLAIDQVALELLPLTGRQSIFQVAFGDRMLVNVAVFHLSGRDYRLSDPYQAA